MYIDEGTNKPFKIKSTCNFEQMCLFNPKYLSITNIRTLHKKEIQYFVISNGLAQNDHIKWLQM
jgi:hypothetical protein